MYYENEKGYLNLLNDTLNKGSKKTTRNGVTISRFGTMINFENISEKLPLMTTKKVFVRGIIEELLWFLKGSTDAKLLQDKNIHIWDGNSSREYLDNNGFESYKEGELGPVYGWQWRNFGKVYNKEGHSRGIDQIKYVIEELLKDNNSRRAILTAWNPLQLDEMALPPCHMLYSFYKDDDGLSCLMTMRSSDLFLGLPFNIASTAILTHIIAKVLHIKPDKISISICDSHIYEEHINSVNTQLEREIYELPQLRINLEAPSINSSIDEKINWINNLNYENFILENYKCHSTIKAEMK
jgi:thymidylate synthase